MDVKSTFIHGDLHKEIYMKQLDGFKKEDKENMACKLKKSLYDLNQFKTQKRNNSVYFATLEGIEPPTTNCLIIRGMRSTTDTTRKPR